MDYSQPDFYRFNSDSIELVNFLAHELENQEIHSVLDIFSGSGVLGLELKQRKAEIEKVDFVELQDDFIIHLEKNIQTFFPNNRGEIFLTSFFDFFPQEKYDLLIANPPYFNINDGRPYLDKKRETARTFSADSKEKFFEKLLSLKDYFQFVFFVMRGEVDQMSFIQKKRLPNNTFIYQLA